MSVSKVNLLNVQTCKLQFVRSVVEYFESRNVTEIDDLIKALKCFRVKGKILRETI